jgi:hypothetical protein
MRTYTRDGYRQMAETCLDWAEKARSADERKTLLELAGEYMWLSRHAADHLHRGKAHRGADHNPARHPHDAGAN